MNSAGVRLQLTTIAELRWRMFVNGLRTRRGKMELASRVIVTSVFALGGLGGFGLAIGMSWFFVSDGRPEFLAIPLWAVFLFWQLFPVMATAFTNNPDSSELLRFPLTYRTYLLVRLAYGYFDPASALGSVGLLGVLIGVTVARPSLFPWTLLVLLIFALFNLVLMQMIFAWIERWLAQRRTREIFGVVFILYTTLFRSVPVAAAAVGRRATVRVRRAGASSIASGPCNQCDCAGVSGTRICSICFAFLPCDADAFRGIASSRPHPRSVSRRKFE